MINKKNILTLLLASMSVFLAEAYDFEIDGIYYNILSKNSRTVEVTYRDPVDTGYRGTVTVPPAVVYEGDLYDVTAIGEHAFDNSEKLTEINLPEGITVLKEYSFAHCTALKGIKLPATLTDIKGSAFDYCAALESIRLPEVINIGSSSFGNCTSLVDIDLGEKLQTIGTFAFRGSTLLPKISIPASVIYIGDYSFLYCTALKEIEVAEANKFYSWADGLLLNKEKTAVLACAQGNTEIVVPEGITKITDTGFYGAIKLEKISLPSTLTSIGSSSFYGCAELLQLDIPESVTSIGEGAFRSCVKLTSIKLPSALTEISDMLFASCAGLKAIEIPDGVVKIGETAFAECSSLESVEIGNGVSDIKMLAFSFCPELKDVVFGYGLKNIGTQAFRGCPKIEHVECHAMVPPDVTGDYLFENRVYEDAMLYVPAESREAYETTAPWSSFMSITGSLAAVGKISHVRNQISITIADGVLNIAGCEEEVVTVADLSGKIYHHGTMSKGLRLPGGVYMVKAGSEIFKIILK